MISITIVISIEVVIYSWSFRVFVRINFMATIIAYDTGRIEIALKNIETVNIISLNVKIVVIDSSKLVTPIEHLLKNG